MKSALLTIFFVLEVSTSFAIDTLAAKHLMLSIPWNTPAIGASENPDGLTTTIIGQNGYTWVYPHGTMNTIMYPAFVNDILEEAVAVRSRFIYASVGSTLIKYEWPGMKELERHRLNAVITLINVWTQDRIAVLAGDNVWAFFVDQPFNAGRIVSTEPTTSISSHDSTLYMATSEGKIFRARGSSVDLLVETQRAISHIAASSTFIAMNHPQGSNAALYALRTGRVTVMSAALGGRAISMCNDSTVALRFGNKARVYTIDTSTGEYITYRQHYYGGDMWRQTSRIFPISNQLFMQGYLDAGISVIMHGTTGYDYIFSTTFRPRLPITVTSDSTIAVCAHARRPEYSLDTDDSTTYNNIFEFNVNSGIAQHARRAPFVIYPSIELARVDSLYYLTRQDKFEYYTSRVGPKEKDVEHYPEYLQVLSRGPRAWMFHWGKGQYRTTQARSSSDGGRTWGTIDMPGFWSSAFFKSACQIGFNDRLYGPTYFWLNLHYFQANEKYLWFTEPIASPENDVIPMYTLPVRDHAMMLILDRKPAGAHPSRIWYLDYGDKTSKARLFTVPGVGNARVLSADVHDRVMMGLWETLDGKNMGLFITDGSVWNYYGIPQNSFSADAKGTASAPNDTTLVFFDALAREFVVYHPKLPTPVGVSDDRDFGSQSEEVIRQVSSDGNVRWRHDINNATISIFDVHGRQYGSVLTSDISCEMQLPGRGLFIIQASGSTELKRLLVVY